MIKSIDQLTRRELEILDYIYSGKSDEAIAAAATISVGTVKTHTRRIYSKTYTSGRVELLAKKIQEQQRLIDCLRRDMDALQADCRYQLDLLNTLCPGVLHEYQAPGSVRPELLQKIRPLGMNAA